MMKSGMPKTPAYCLAKCINCVVSNAESLLDKQMNHADETIAKFPLYNWSLKNWTSVDFDNSLAVLDSPFWFSRNLTTFQNHLQNHSFVDCTGLVYKLVDIDLVTIPTWRKFIPFAYKARLIFQATSERIPFLTVQQHAVNCAEAFQSEYKLTIDLSEQLTLAKNYEELCEVILCA